MGLPSNTNALQNGFWQGYQIGRSLRFRSSASAYLNRTPSVASGFNQWTLSVWFKRCSIGATQYLIGGNTTTSGFRNELQVQISSGDQLAIYAFNNGGGYYFNRFSSMLFRDPSAWYHLVVQFDPDNATSANKIIAYVNGVQVSWGSSADSGVSGSITSSAYRSINNTYRNDINGGYQSGGAPVYFSDNYLAEMNMVSGSLISPFSFGGYDSNGIWQPKKYTGTYGTNGFYLPFSNTTSTTTLVQDASGNGNNWTPNNISLTAGTTYDSMLDVPTNNSATAANFAVLNPLAKNSAVTLGSANLNYTDSNPTNAVQAATFWTSTGKWYWETTLIAAGGGNYGLGIVGPTYNQNTYGYNSGQDSYLYLSNGNYYEGSTSSAYGASYTTNDVIGIALDCGAGTITFYKNNVSQGTKTGTNLANKLVSAMITTSQNTASAFNAAINFGQRPFSYTPPTGFVALNAANLPTPLISNGAQYMAATTYTGNNSTNTINNGNNTTISTTFQPDMVWIKSRSSVTNHMLDDSVRGVGKDLFPNLTSAESTTNIITSFNSNGFTLGPDGGGAGNGNGLTYVGWQWKAGGTAVSNNSGTITSSVSANASAGFSVATYTGTGANATVGHGLGVAPSMIIIKNRTDGTRNWQVYHASQAASPANGSLNLNTTGAYSADSTVFNNTVPTSSVFSVGTAAASNGSTNAMVAYCFAAVSGYSAFGSYNGTGSADGAFIYTGFRPRFILHKASSTTSQWMMWDTSRNTYNVLTNAELLANSSSAEGSGAWGTEIDILSNGFKFRGFDNTNFNYTGITYIYACFSENPFQISRAR